VDFNRLQLVRRVNRILAEEEALETTEDSISNTSRNSNSSYSHPSIMALARGWDRPGVWPLQIRTSSCGVCSNFAVE
jgi:hypothetical protein